MTYTRVEMLFDDGEYYKWKASGDKENPTHKKSAGQQELHRTEGEEVLYFINDIGQTRWKNVPTLPTYQKMEKMIRYHVPSDIRTLKRIEDWIIDNWSSIV
jgi:hypothetical protein